LLVPHKFKRAFTPTLNDNLNEKSQRTTMYKNNSGFIAKTKVSKCKKGLCLTEKLVHINPLLFLY